MQNQEWQPNPEGLNKIMTLLTINRQPSSDPIQKEQANTELNQLHQLPEYNKYLAYIYTKTNTENEINIVAGLVLKNNIRTYYDKMTPDVKNYIKSEVVKCIGHPTTLVRRTVGVILAEIIYSTDLTEVPGIVPYFTQLLSSDDVAVIDGTLHALDEICRDLTREKLDDVDSRELSGLLLKIISYFSSPHESFRAMSTNILSDFIIPCPKSFSAHIDTYVKALFNICKDPSAKVRKTVCSSFTTLVQTRFDYIDNYAKHLIEFFLQATQDPDPSVSLEACEFWGAIVDIRACGYLIKPFLPNIIPMFIDKMVYTEEALIDLVEQDSSIPDKPEDIRPFQHSSSSIEEDDDSDDDLGDDNPEKWDVRKCAAAALDVYALSYGEELLPILIPIFQQIFEGNKNWIIQEAGVLALGAVADGCMEYMKEFLPKIIPFLVELLKSPQHLLRSISCWAIMRYSEWLFKYSGTQEDPDLFFRPVLKELLDKVVDNSKKVQESAISTLAEFFEIGKNRFVPYAQPILFSLVSALTKYQAKNLILLYDAIGTLANSVGSALNTPENLNILLPPLFNIWNNISDDDERLLPLLECFAPVATALGEGFIQFLQPVVERCFKLIEFVLNSEIQRANIIPHPDFIVCSLDLLSAIVEGLKEKSSDLCNYQNGKLLQLTFLCMKHEVDDVRQSAFSMLGELIKHCFPKLDSVLKDYVPVILDNLDSTHSDVCNNACWALGELAMKLGPQMSPLIEVSLNRLIPILRECYHSRVLIENTAITIGRLGFVCPELVAPKLAEFVERWCRALRDIRDDPEKESAFKGLCLMITLNPSGALKDFSWVCDAFCGWYETPHELHQMFYQILHGFKQNLGQEQWAKISDKWPGALAHILKERYQI